MTEETFQQYGITSSAFIAHSCSYSCQVPEVMFNIKVGNRYEQA